MTDLAQKARLAVAWTTGLYLLRDIVQFGLMLVLVRLLPLDAYGQFGLLNTIIGFMMVFSSREFIAHTLLVRDDRDVNYQEQFIAGCVIQSTLFATANIAAIAFRWFPTYAPVAPALHVMSLTFLLDLPAQIRTKMLERALDWQRLRTIEAVGIVGGALTSLALGLAGVGVYALILPSFVMSCAFITDLFLISGWRPTFVWHPGRYNASMKFGMKRVLSQVFVSASNLIESGFLARAVGYVMLGVFGRAMSMATLFCQRVATLLMSSLYPVLARVPRGSDSYKRISALVLRTVVWIVVPSATIVSLLGDHIVATLYGTRWLAAIPLVPAAMAVGACLAVGEASYGLLLAHHEPRRCLYVDVWRLIGVSSALGISLRFGLNSYLSALVLVYGIQICAMIFWLHQSGAIRLSGVATAFLPAGAAAILAGLCVEILHRWTVGEWPVVPLMLACGAVFVTIYLVTLRVLFASLLHEVVGYLPRGERVHRLLGFAEAT